MDGAEGDSLNTLAYCIKRLFCGLNVAVPRGIPHTFTSAKISLCECYRRVTEDLGSTPSRSFSRKIIFSLSSGIETPRIHFPTVQRGELLLQSHDLRRKGAGDLRCHFRTRRSIIAICRPPHWFSKPALKPCANNFVNVCSSTSRPYTATNWF